MFSELCYVYYVSIYVFVLVYMSLCVVHYLHVYCELLLHFLDLVVFDMFSNACILKKQISLSTNSYREHSRILLA